MDFLNAIVLLLNYLFVPALSYGSQLALGAIFVSLIYGILRFAYFTAGDLMSFGTMFTILFTWYFQSLGINLGIFPTALLAIPFGVAITILYVLIKDKLVFDNDFIISKGFDHGFSRLIHSIKKGDWDIIYLGASQWCWDDE